MPFRHCNDRPQSIKSERPLSIWCTPLSSTLQNPRTPLLPPEPGANLGPDQRREVDSGVRPNDGPRFNAATDDHSQSAQRRGPAEHSPVVPVEAGTQSLSRRLRWIPAFAGMTKPDDCAADNGPPPTRTAGARFDDQGPVVPAEAGTQVSSASPRRA